MADQKIFAGPRVKRIRNQIGITQTAMAEALGISPSYLNLIERNQRPLTVQILLKLSSIYKIDLEELQGDKTGVTNSLKEVFSDPLLSGELAGNQELLAISDVAPNAAAGIVKLYRAYREKIDRLTELSDLLVREGHASAVTNATLPIDEVRAILEKRPNYFEKIEKGAESFHELLKLGDDMAYGLKNWLKSAHGITVRVVPVAAMPNLSRRFDRHSMRLFLSERLSPFDQKRELAIEVCLLGLIDEIKAELNAMNLKSDEARRIARFELARYAAHALMMPYSRFLAAAERAKYDIDVLRSRFSVSYEQAANRLTMMQRVGHQGIPFFMLEIDNAGHNFRKAGAKGFPQARFGGGCPKLNIHAAFMQPGQVLVDTVELTDGAEFLVVSRTLEGPQSAFNERVRRTALMVACDIGYGMDTVYGQSMKREAKSATLVGAACRLCERSGCLSRAESPLTKPLGLDEMVAGLSAFDFQ